MPLSLSIFIFLSIKVALFNFKLQTGLLKFLFFPAASITAFLIEALFLECNSKHISLSDFNVFSNITNPLYEILYLYCLPLTSFIIV